MSNTPNDRYNGIKRSCDSDDESDASSDCIQLTPLEAISPSTSRSPGSKSKYYSPTKKRYVNKRQPFKKRLDMDSLCPMEDSVLKEASAGIDDKSIFLLKVINKYLSNESLKNLLDETSQEIIKKCFNAVKPGIVIVCRMYWRKTLWYRYDDVVKISKEHYKKCDTPTVQEMIQYLVQNGILICGEF
ncbi:hypothetical protein O3G_MSEX009785 [Manduca sexta]|uniref:Uncharacterized protein n=1 Tax=Manduca sexta TaxID=7130 RepID=A0A921ZFA2_MANSE|nr:hypothetical protein O3G_MSEX009785 [Manduca sexta]